MNQYTKAEALALPAGRELDAIVGKLAEFKPEITHGVSDDGGESWMAWVDRRGGPWYTLAELKEWLASEQVKGRYAGYDIVASERWPHYSTDIAAAWPLFERLREKYGFTALQYDGTWYCVLCARIFASAKTAPWAICRAVIESEMK